MKVVFLDIDGVLNLTHTSSLAGANFSKARNRKNLPLNPNIKAVNSIFEGLEGENYFVISSTYRFGNTKEGMENLLQQHGFEGVLHEDWATKMLYCERGKEVQEWLSRHSDVEAWVCLDDNNNFSENDRLVLTDTCKGLLSFDALLAQYLLGIISADEALPAKEYYQSLSVNYNLRYFSW